MNKNIFLLAGLIVAIAFTGCRKDFEEINTNPNEPTTVSTGFLLTAAQKRIMDENMDSFWGSRRGMQMSQFWSSNQYSNESRYQFRTDVTNGAWRDFYAGVLQDLQQIIDLNTDSPDDVSGYGDNGNQIAVATVLQAWTYQLLTDAFGAIPMGEALSGTDNLSPAYDSQQAVYGKLVSMLDGAIAGMDAGASGPNGDQIYGGDMSAWATFANSLKLRVAMRMSDVDAAGAKAAGESAIAGGVITANADNAAFPYIDAAPNNNPVNEANKTRNDFAASNTMIDFLTGLNDPRMQIYYEPSASDGVYIGEVYGLDETNAALTPDAVVSQPGAMALGGGLPGIFMDAAQVNFLLAEAAERGWAGAGDAEANYNAGVTASFEFWGADGAADYLAQADVAYGSAAGTYSERIGRQKWVALYMQGQEAWAEYRRMDFGVLLPCADGALAGDGSVPSRMEYPLDEQTLNYDSYSAGVASLGGADALETKLWWDVN
jgi:hypothetical protein